MNQIICLMSRKLLNLNLPNPCTRCTTELDSFQGYWHYIVIYQAKPTQFHLNNSKPSNFKWFYTILYDLQKLNLFILINQQLILLHCTIMSLTNQESQSWHCSGLKTFRATVIWWWWWLMFYGHFCAQGRLNGPSDLQR